MYIVHDARNIFSTPDRNAPNAGHTTNLLIQGCALLSPSEPGKLLRDQDILIHGQHVVAIGPSGTLPYNPLRIDRVIRGEGRIAMPGLVNAHTHSLENVLKASSPSLPLELWLVSLFANAMEWSPRLVYLSTLLGAVEMLKTGTTAVLDHLWTGAGVAAHYLDATMNAYRDAGIRASVAPSIEDQDLVLDAAANHGLALPSHPFIDRFALWAPIAEQVAVLEQFIDTWHNTENGRLRCLVGPSGIHWCSRKLLEDCREMADRYETGMHLHAVETELQASIIKNAMGQGGIRYLDQLGLLRPGTSLAHTIWLEDGDLPILARTGTTVVHNPISNLRLGSGRFPLRAALQQGVPVALGSDGSASNDNQNMFGVLKLTGLMHNLPDLDYKKWPQAEEILAMATSGGSTALGLASGPRTFGSRTRGIVSEQEMSMQGKAVANAPGEIVPEQLADLVLIDLDSDAFLPLHDPYLHLIYCEHGVSVDTVIVNGEVVVERGRVINLDEQALRREIREHYRTVEGALPAHLEYASATSDVLASLDALRRLILPKHDGE
ncbi:MAG: amidohydrolase family protein [Ktedonobacteraceae bacterium]|nr:amidohydrolase family protein [Ktedonobacteraceae bacterium]